MKRLVVEEFILDESQARLHIGNKYSYFKDPKTGKYYRPREDFEVNGDNLEELFEEIVYYLHPNG